MDEEISESEFFRRGNLGFYLRRTKIIFGKFEKITSRKMLWKERLLAQEKLCFSLFTSLKF